MGNMTKICCVCNSVFTLTHPAQTMCSKECQKKRHRYFANRYYNKTTAKKREVKKKEIKKRKLCVLCGAETRGFICMGEECRKEYHRVFTWTYNRMKNNTRASGKHYENTPEKLNAIKEKYKNGVTDEHLKEMIRGLE